MIAWVLFDETGMIPRSASNGSRSPGPGYVAMEVGQIWPVRLLTMMLVDGIWIPRPALESPAVDGASWVFSVPNGATCEVIDAETGVSLATVGETAGQIELSFPESGDYALEFSLPPEWMPASKRISIP